MATKEDVPPTPLPIQIPTPTSAPTANRNPNPSPPPFGCHCRVRDNKTKTSIFINRCQSESQQTARIYINSCVSTQVGRSSPIQFHFQSQILHLEKLYINDWNCMLRPQLLQSFYPRNKTMSLSLNNSNLRIIRKICKNYTRKSESRIFSSVLSWFVLCLRRNSRCP